jgi:hypothetical protein
MHQFGKLLEYQHRILAHPISILNRLLVSQSVCFRACELFFISYQFVRYCYYYEQDLFGVKIAVFWEITPCGLVNN